LLSAGGSTLSPNNLNLLDNDAFQIQNNVVAQVASEGQGSDENSISSASGSLTQLQFVDNLDEVAPVSIPVEFRPPPSTKVTVEFIDSVAPHSVPSPATFGSFYPAGYSKYEYKLQMSSDGNPIQPYGAPALGAGSQLWSHGLPPGQGPPVYTPSIHLHPKWPGADLDQVPNISISGKNLADKGLWILSKQQKNRICVSYVHSWMSCQ
jgi:hypothetical protein